MTVPVVAITSAERYVQKGLTKDAACAIISVLYAGESGLNPGPQPSTSHTDKGGILFADGAMGIASWNGSRQRDLANFAARKGESAWALNTQLDFVLTECANSYPDVWKFISAKPSLPYLQIIPIFVEKYENPGNPQAEIERAKTFARELYPLISSIPSQLPQPQIPTIPVSTTMPIAQILQIMQAAGMIFQALAPIIEQIHKDLSQMQGGQPLPINIGHVVSPPPPVDVSALAQELGPLLQQILAQLPHPTQPKA